MKHGLAAGKCKMADGGMVNRFLILGVFLGLAGCGSTTRVISDNSVAHQFSVFNKSGWTVSEGGNKQTTASAKPQPGAAIKASTFDTFGRATWSTNFHLDDGPPSGPVGAPPVLSR
jgi:hypothetical protein